MVWFLVQIASLSLHACSCLRYMDTNEPVSFIITKVKYDDMMRSVRMQEHTNLFMPLFYGRLICY
jgi:hypothetical protein